MSDREKKLLTYLSRAEEAERLLKEKGLHYANGSFIWQILQIEYNLTDIPTEVLFKDLTVSDIVAVIVKHKYLYGEPLGQVEVDKSILLEGLDDSLIKAHLKFKGEIWVIHKNDKDTFPSNPHAHNYESNVKLHLGNGELYRTKELCGQVRKKELIALRDLIKTRLPSLDLPQLS